MTSCNQGLSSDQGRQRRETLGTRLRAAKSSLNRMLRHFLLDDAYTRIEFPEGWEVGDIKKNPFHKGGMDISWNYILLLVKFVTPNHEF